MPKLSSAKVSKELPLGGSRCDDSVLQLGEIERTQLDRLGRPCAGQGARRMLVGGTDGD